MNVIMEATPARMTEAERTALRQQINRQAAKIEESRLKLLALSDRRFVTEVGKADVRELRSRYDAAQRNRNLHEP